MREDRNSPNEVLVRRLIGNIVAGIVVMYGVTVALCLPSQSLTMAAGVAALPAVFAGPFLGGLVTMVMATQRAEAAEARGAASAEWATELPVVTAIALPVGV